MAAEQAEGMLLHPIALFRLAGEPATALTGLGNGTTAAAVAALDAFKRGLGKRAAMLSAEMEAVVQRAYAEHPDCAKKLLQLKRDVYNLRPSRVTLDQVAHAIPETLHAPLRSLIGDIPRLQGMAQAVKDAYGAEMEAARAGMAEAFAGQNLRQGIIYTDLAVFRDLDRMFREARPERRKKEKILENTFLNYLLRTTLKTSPMSAFTPILECRWQAGTGTPLQRAYPAWRLQTRTTLRKGLVHAFVAPVLDKQRAQGQVLRLNPGLRDDGAGIKLYDVTPWQAVWGSVWRRNTMTRSGVLVALIALFRDGGGTMTAEQIVEGLAARLPQSAHAGLPGLVDVLLARRVLLPALPLGEQEDSVRWAERLLAGLPGDDAAVVRQGLADLDDTVRRHAASRADDRLASAAAVEQALHRLREGAACLRPDEVNPVFYEDCAVDDPDAHLDPALLDPARTALEQLLRLSPIFDNNTRFQTDMADKFIDAFGEDGVCTDVQGFLESGFDPMAARFRAPGPDTARYPLNAQLAALRRDFDAMLYACYRAGGDIVLTPQALDPFIARLPHQLRARTASYAFHAQFYDCEGGRPGLVLNKVYPGYSIMYSRFLAPSDRCRDDIGAYLRTLADDATFLEVPGSFGLNTNLHPPMVEAELGIAPFAPNRVDAPRVPIDALRLRYDRVRHRVRMEDAQGRHYAPLFFGMSVPHVLPTLHCTLSAMHMQSGMSLAALVMKTVLERDADFDSQQVLRIPRLSIGQLVLGRRSVHIPAAHFPAEHDDEGEYFVAVQRWRELLGLPRDGFIQLAAAPLLRPAEFALHADQAGQARRWKPFYVDFTNPMLVRLLHRALRAQPARMTVQETLPGADDQWLTVAGRKHVAEIHFEASIKGC